MIYGGPTVYEVHMPLKLDGDIFGSVRARVSTVCLRAELSHRLQRALALFLSAVVVCIVLAVSASFFVRLR